MNRSRARSTSIPRLGAICALFAVYASVSCGRFAGDIESSRDIRLAEAIDDSVGTIRIDVGAGRLTLRTADDDARRIEIDGVLIANGRDETEAAERAEGLDMSLSTEGSVASVRFTAPNAGNPRAEVRMTVPPNVDLDVRLSAGTIDARIDLPPSTRIEISAGDVLVALALDAAARVEAGTLAGELEIEGFTTSGPVERTLAGARFVGTIGEPANAKAHHLHVRNTAGRTRIIERGAR